jgi:fatty-acyl-CoA synthase
MNIGESLPRNAQHFPDKPAIVDLHRSVSYRELQERTNRLANYLLSRGIAKGSLVGLSCGSRAEHFEALFSLAKIGAVAVPFDFNWSPKESEAMLRFFAPTAFFLERRQETEGLTQIALERVPPDNLLLIGSSGSGHTDAGSGVSFESAIRGSTPRDPEIPVHGLDPYLLMITSGTTGFPKACSINHETYSLRCMNYAMTKGMHKDERALMTLPVHFNAGRGSVMSILYLGGTIYIHERFDTERLLRTIERERITYTMLVPTLCERLLRLDNLDHYRTDSLRYLGITGGHLSRESARAIRRTLCADLSEAYASTDCGQITTLAGEDWESRSDSVGKPIWCVLVRIADDDGREVPIGREGEVCVRTPLAIQGYYKNQQATDEFFAGGWCHTGDIGFLDQEGYLYISGRKKNMIKSGGISIFPEEIEETLRKHPAVADAAVIGCKSEPWGEEVKAFVVLHRDAECSADVLIRFCKKSLASYKAPRSVEFLSELPRTGLGKIERAKLAANTRNRQ